MAGVFSRGKASRGFKAAEKEQKKRTEAREARMGKLFRFFLKDGDEDVPVRFLTEEPILLDEHMIKNGNSYDHYPCTQDDDCEWCADGNKASYKGAWLIADGREFERAVYKDGKKTDKKQMVRDQLRLYVRGQTDVAKMNAKSRKFGLTSRPWFISKTGSNQSTSYELERGDSKDPLTVSQIKKLIEQLPKEYQEMFDPKNVQDSLMDIVEAQLFGLESEDTGRADEDDDEDDVEEEDEDLDSGVQSLDDDDDDEEEEEKPKSRIKKPGAKTPSKPTSGKTLSKPKPGIKKPAAKAPAAAPKKPGLRKPKR